MSAFSHRGFRYGVLAMGVLALFIWGVSLSCHQSAPRRRLGFADLQDRLQRHGIDLQVVSTRKDGGESDSVFLLAKPRDFGDLNVLSKNPSRIREWDGVLYCERIGRDPDALVEQWGANCMIVEPFILYGDPALLEQVRGALQDVHLEK